MKILYYTYKKYAWNVYGTTRSMAEELENNGHEVRVVDRQHIDNILRDTGDADQVWLVNSGLTIDKETKSRINIPVIGFGLSDPYEFTTSRFDSYDAYITNYFDTYDKYKHKIKCHYFPVGCNIKFHTHKEVEKTSYASIIGCAIHPRFTDTHTRLNYINELRSCGIQIDAYGDGWTNHKDNHRYISGNNFISAIQKSKIGVDIQEDYSPLAHRIFEYGACGVPSITRNRPEVYEMFDDDEILTYDTFEDLKDKLLWYKNRTQDLNIIGMKALKRCRKDHDITNRIRDLLTFLKGAFVHQ